MFLDVAMNSLSSGVMTTDSHIVGKVISCVKVIKHRPEFGSWLTCTGRAQFSRFERGRLVM